MQPSSSGSLFYPEDGSDFPRYVRKFQLHYTVSHPVDTFILYIYFSCLFLSIINLLINSVHDFKYCIYTTMPTDLSHYSKEI